MLEEILKPQSLVQILVFAVVFYAVLAFIRGTSGAGVLKGFVFLIGATFILLMFVADLFRFVYVKQMLQWTLSGSFFALIVIFAPEMRRGLNRLSQSPLLSPLFHEPHAQFIDEVSSAAVRLARNRIGMLVAIEREVGLGEYVEQGVPVNGEVSHELLESLFYPGSALHDGAVIIRKDRIAAAGCLFPLTDNPALSKSTGTRHRAAIGISEITDAIAVVVSEETGRIAVAIGGKMMTDLNAKTLEQALRELYTRSDRPTRSGQRISPSAEDTSSFDPSSTPPTIQHPTGGTKGGEA